MAGFSGTDDLINILIAENVGLRTVQHLLRKNHELYNELRSHFNVTSLVPFREFTRKDGQGFLPPDNAPQETRDGSNTAGSRLGAPGRSCNRATPAQRDPLQTAFTGRPMSPGGHQPGPFPTIMQRSQSPAFSPTRIARAVRPTCPVSPEQKVSPFPGTPCLAQAGWVDPGGPLGSLPDSPVPGPHQGLAGGPQPFIPRPLQASASVPTVQVTLTYHGAGSTESGAISAAQLSAAGAPGHTCSGCNHTSTGASMGQAHAPSDLAGGVGQAHTGSPRTTVQAAAHNSTYAPGAMESGPLSAAAPQPSPPSCSPTIQQLAQAYSLLSSGSPLLSLGQTYSPQEFAFFPPSIPSPLWASTPSPVLPQAPAGPPALQKPPPAVLQPPPPGWKAKKPPSPGAAARTDVAQVPAPPGPPAALPARTQDPQSPPGMWPKECRVSTNQEAASKTSGDTKSEESKKEATECTVGEMADHLGSRTLSSIYGFSAHNAPQMVMEAFAIVERYAALMNRLKPLGYDPNVHPKLTEQIVKTFGTFRKRPPDPACFSDIRYLRDLVKATAAPDRLSDCLVLLNCLYQLSLDDGKPLFIW